MTGAPRPEALADRPAPARHHVRRRAQRPVADDAVALRRRQVEERRAVHVDPQRRELGGDDAVAQRHRLERRLLVAIVEKPHHRRPAPPVRRPEPRHAAALLVDQHRRRAAHRAAQLGDEAMHLLRLADVAAEQDEAPRVRLGEEGALGLPQLGPRHSEDDRPRHQPLTATRQSWPRDCRARQTFCASIRSSKGPARRRKKRRPPEMVLCTTSARPRRMSSLAL